MIIVYFTPVRGGQLQYTVSLVITKHGSMFSGELSNID